MGEEEAKCRARAAQAPGFLFVTFGEGRVDNVHRKMHDLPSELAPYCRFTTLELARADLLGPI